MPYIDPTEFDLGASPEESFRQIGALPPKLRGNFSHVVGSAVRQENIGANVAGWANRLFHDSLYASTREAGFNPFTDDRYKRLAEMYPEQFSMVDSSYEADRLARRVTQENNDREVLRNAGGMGLVATAGAVVLDPANLIPVPFVSAAARAGSRGAFAAAERAGATRALAQSDNLARMGVKLTRSERSALRQGAISREAINAAKALPVEQRAAVLEQARSISTREREIAGKLKEFRGRAPTVEELQEFYVERQVQALRAGRPIEEVGRKSVSQITKNAEEADRKLYEMSVRLRDKGPTREELKEFYAEDFMRAFTKEAPFDPPEMAVGLRGFRDIDPKTGMVGRGTKTSELREYFERRQHDQIMSGRPPLQLPAERRARAALSAARAADTEATERAFLDAAKSVKPDEKGLREYYAKVQREQILGDAPRVKLPAERRILQELAEARGERLAANKAALEAAESIVPVVISETGLVKKIATAERIERAQRSAIQKVGAVRQALVKAAQEAADQVRLPGAVGRGARAGAAAGALQGGMEELTLNAIQVDRDDALIANTFFGAAILGTLFGAVGAAAGHRMARKVEDAHLALTEDLTFGDILARMPDSDKIAPSAFRSQSFESSFDDLVAKMKKTSGNATKLVGEDTFFVGRAIKAIMHYHPTGRLAKSKFKAAREMIQKLMPTPYLRMGQGFGPSVQARMRLHSEVGHGIVLRVEDFARARAKHGMDYEEFMMETARALRNGGKLAADAPKELKDAVGIARRYFDEWEVRLKEVGMIPEKVDLGADLSYLPRVYNFEAIRNRRGEFRAILAKHVGGEEADQILDEITRFQGVYDPDAFNFLGTSRTGATKTRGLRDIPSDELEEFLVNDTNFLIQHYSQTVGAQFEYARLFPDVEKIEDRLNLRPIKDKMRREADLLAAKAKNPTEQARIYRQLDKDLKDLEYVRQTHLGFLNRDPFDLNIRRISNVATGATAGMYLGNAGFNSLTDTATMFFANGLGPGFRAAMSKVRHPLSLLMSKLSKDEMSRLARQVEYAGLEHTRLQNFFDFTADHGIAPLTFGERGARATKTMGEKAHRAVMVGSGMAWITGVARELNMISSQDAVLRILKKGRAYSTLNRRDMNLLKLAGIDEELAVRIQKELGEGLQIDDVGNHFAVLEKWNPRTAEDYRAAIIQNSMRGVLNPAKGELPKSFNNPLGRILFMFLSFPADATNKLLVSGAQRMDTSVAGGIAMMTGVGYFIEKVNSMVRGETDVDEQEIVERGFERAGFPGLLANFWHVMSRSSLREYDPLALLGIETAYERYGGIQGVGDIVPPAAAFEDTMKFFRTTRKLLQGEDISEQEAEATVRRAPLLRGIQFYPVTNAISEAIKADPRTFE